MSVEAPEEVDQSAPYGRNPRTGAPYKRPAAERERLAANLKRARAAGRGGKATRTRSAKPTGPVDPFANDPVAKAAAQLLSIPVLVLTAIGHRRKDATLIMDAVAFSRATPELASGMSAVAAEDERIGAWLEKISAVTPYSGLAMAGIGLLLQLGANHRMVPVIEELGIVDPDDLLAEVMGSDAGDSGGGIPAQDVRGSDSL